MQPGVDGGGKGEYVAGDREEQEQGMRGSPNILDEYVTKGRVKQEQGV